MTVIAYFYSDPLLDAPPQQYDWGREVDRVYQDFGQRQQLEQLMSDCLLEPPQYLLIRCLQELGDSSLEICDRFKQLSSLGIEIITLELDNNYSPTKQITSEYFQDNLAVLLSQIQTAQYRRRLRQGHARNRLKSLPPPGKAPYGYRRGKDKYIIDKSTSPIVKDFFERFLLFGSLRGAVRYLEKRYGKKIAPSTGRQWLTNPVYRGDLQYKNREIISDTHAAIISREEAAQIDRLLRRNSRLPKRTASAPRSLAGLVSCQQCQTRIKITRVTRKNKPQEYLYLRPINCPQQPKCKAIAYQEVLEQTITSICQDLPLAVSQVNLTNLEGTKELLNKTIAQKQKILKKLPSLIEAGILDQETAELRSYKLKTEIAQLTQKIAQLPPVNLLAIAKTVSLPQFWLDLSESERRFYFREFIKQIEIVRHQSSRWDLKLIFIF
jgi:DNA invertase Pin-like site-specific DNA recombinase